jgi:hypothetical protein
LQPGSRPVSINALTDPTIPATFSLEDANAEAVSTPREQHAIIPPGSSREALEPLLVVVHDDLMVTMAAKAAETLFFGEADERACAGDLLQARASASVFARPMRLQTRSCHLRLRKQPRC